MVNIGIKEYQNQNLSHGKKNTQIDLGLDFSLYPKIKKKFNKTHQRKLLYIGNDYSYNNIKNLNYLRKISKSIGK